MKDAIAKLLSSRKFLIVSLALIACTVLAAMGKIPVSSLASNIQILAGVLVAAIGAEGVAEKWNTTPNSVTTTTIAKSEGASVAVTEKISEKVSP